LLGVWPLLGRAVLAAERPGAGEIGEDEGVRLVQIVRRGAAAVAI
jgi:hypothetical protein